MSENLDLELETLLRDGLRRLPAPEPSSNFDDRVLAALHQPLPWWRRLWPEARPLLIGTSCSFVVALAVLSWGTQMPTTPPQHPASPPATLSRPLDMAAVDRLLDRPDLSALSLSELPRLAAEDLRKSKRPPPPPVKGRVSSLHAPLIA